MKKRGQVTTFIIVGIIALVAILIVFFLRNTIFEAVAGAERVNSYLQGQMDAVGDEIERCIDESSKKGLETLGKQGGYFEPKHYQMFYGTKISFLCMDIPGEPRCRNNMLTKKEVEEQLNDYMSKKLKNCINLEGFSFGRLYDYDLIYDINSLKIESDIFLKRVLFNVKFPVMIKRNEFELSKEEFINVVDVPLGEALDLVKMVLDYESAFGVFVLNMLDLGNKPLYVLRRHMAGYNKIYFIEVIEGGYKFNFAIEDSENIRAE